MKARQVQVYIKQWFHDKQGELNYVFIVISVKIGNVAQFRCTQKKLLSILFHFIFHKDLEVEKLKTTTCVRNIRVKIHPCYTWLILCWCKINSVVFWILHSVNFEERNSFRSVSGQSSETVRKLCFSAKFQHLKIRWNFSILRILYNVYKLLQNSKWYFIRINTFVTKPDVWKGL